MFKSEICDKTNKSRNIFPGLLRVGEWVRIGEEDLRSVYIKHD